MLKRMCWLLMAAYLYVNLCELVPGHRLPRYWDSTIAFAGTFFLLSLLHAGWALGWRNAGLFFLISAVVAYAFEEVGVRTGWVYGSYHYSDMLGPKLGHVPVMIPLSWFMMVYPCYVISSLLAGGRGYGPVGSFGGSVMSVVLGAALMTGWDLVMDSGMTAAGYWVWHEGGPWWGVPLHNFGGWMATTLTVFGVYRLVERKQTGEPSKWMGLIPLGAYGVLFIRYVFDRHENSEIFAMVACFTMGLPLVVAWRLWMVGGRSGRAESA